MSPTLLKVNERKIIDAPLTGGLEFKTSVYADTVSVVVKYGDVTDEVISFKVDQSTYALIDDVASAIAKNLQTRVYDEILNGKNAVSLVAFVDDFNKSRLSPGDAEVVANAYTACAQARLDGRLATIEHALAAVSESSTAVNDVQ